MKATIGDILIFTADERNNALGTLTHETVQDKQAYTLTIHLDDEYLRDENTAYPIRIDPTIEITSAAGAIEDVTLNSLSGSDGDSWSLTIGKRATYGVSRVLMRFPGLSLSAIPSADKITSASVELRDLMCEDEAMMVYCYVFTGNSWTESTANWSNVNPDSYTTLLSSKTVSYSNGASQPSAHRYAFNITNAVKGWKTGNYVQSKGLLFKAPASVENGSTYIKKTFSSYNRSTYKPSLTVNYDAGGSQILANGTYYLNNVQHGDYLRYNASGGAEAKSGWTVALAGSINWELVFLDGAYVLRSAADPTKYLCVPTNTSNTGLEIITSSNSEVPTRCMWIISGAAQAGCLIKNVYNSRYLCTNGSSLYTSSSPGTAGTSTYKSHTWRALNITKMTGRELFLTTKFHYNDMMRGFTNTIKYRPDPIEAIWASESDFTYVVANPNVVSLNAETGELTAKTVGTTEITVTHKVTDFQFTFKVRVHTPGEYRGTLTKWGDAERDIIAHWDTVPTIFKKKIGSDASFYFNSAFNTAFLEWEDALGWSLTTTTQEQQADIAVYGGTREELKQIMGANASYLTDSTAGITFPAYDVTGYYRYNGEVKIYAEMEKATIYIPSDGRPANECRNIVTHELGHALGFLGHSSSSSSVMYPYVSTIYDVQAAEKDHLLQIYS